MRKILLAVVLLASAATVVAAGVNNPGTILFHYNSAAVGTDGVFCGQGGLTTC